jgi:hypothetical protein
MRRLLTLICLLLIAPSGVFAQQTTFEHVKIHRHRSADKRVLVDKIGKLTFDDSAGKLAFESGAGDHFVVGYDDVRKIVFEITTRMRGGVVSQIVKAASFPGLIVGSAIEGGHVNDYWFYLEYSDHDSKLSALMKVPKSSSAEVINKATSAFGSRVTLTDFPERGTTIKMEELKSLKSKQTLKVDKQNHPLPASKPDKATIVVVCPPLAARHAGKRNQFKLHANDQVVAVNRMGTYSFAYLDPGKYRLVSQTENANGFEMQLEGGQEYFFVQNTFQGVFKAETALSRNSGELVMYLVEGSYFSDWKPKK